MPFMGTEKTVLLVALILGVSDGSYRSTSSRSSVSSRSSTYYSYYSYGSSYYHYSSSYSYYRSSGSGSPQSGVIAGSVVGGLCALGIGVALFFYCRANRCRHVRCCRHCPSCPSCPKRPSCCKRNQTKPQNELELSSLPSPTNAASFRPVFTHDQIKYVTNDGSSTEEANGPSSVFPAGEWTGYYEEYGRQNSFSIRLRFIGGEISGTGSDATGEFVFFGAYRDSTQRAAWAKYYGEQHFVEYRGMGSKAGIDGLWASVAPDKPYLGMDAKPFSGTDAFHLQCDKPDEKPSPNDAAKEVMESEPPSPESNASREEPGPPSAPPPDNAV